MSELNVVTDFLSILAVYLQVAYDVIACANNQEIQFRCYFGDTGIYANAM